MQSGGGETAIESNREEVLSGGGVTAINPTRREALSGGGITAEAEEGTPELMIPTQPPAIRFASPQFPMFLYKPPDKIEEGLYLGSLNSASNRDALLELGIKSIVTVANDTGTPQFPDTFSYTVVHVADAMSVDLATHFDGCFTAIEEGRKAGGVLVHCLAGMSRSATIVIAYMMKTKGWDLRTSLSHVRQCRPIVQPNIGFMRQLQEYEVALKNNGKHKGMFARWFS
ncbi:hypothetical protein CLOM_g5002 [Closterium sp. NIES-68]|nr:hypothetical protein CLOM_g5002 [Closterium sp. NIES-68]GJP67824.1 hypothetical protein CLOP_g24592 [Closterium sp. NIES-67]